jgi:hypothetical protein
MVSSLLKAARKAAKQAKDLKKQTKDVLTKPKQTPEGTGQQEFTKTRKAYKLFVQRDDGGLYPLFVDADTRIPEKVFTEANFPKEAFTAPNGRLYVPSKGAKRAKGEKKKGTGVQIIVPDKKTRNMLKDAGYSVSKPKEGAEHGTVLAVAARPGYHASQKPVATHIGPQDIKITNAEAKKLLKEGITPEAIKKRKGQLYVKRRAEDQVFAEVEMADDVNYEQILKDAGKTDINDRVPVGGSYRYVDGQADSDFWVVGGNMKVNRVLSRDEVKTIQQQEGVKDLPYKEEVESILGKKFAEGGLLEGDDMQQGIDDYVVAKTESETMDMNVGGAPKKNLEAQQLEMFGDIGMAKSPAKKDPVSGNEIPKASTAEEVRDDIPARLSEGEFVLPADVVRYHGLEKLMNLRQEAKQGINTMDKMGQLGNAEEATMPDDLPFDVNDIEMSEGGMVNVAGQPMQLPRIAGQQMQMQTGGFVSPTGTYQVPTQLSTTPSYFQNYAQSTAPFTPFVPQTQTAIPPIAPVTPPKTTGPTFQTLIPSEGQRPVTKEYRNAAGQKLFIPFINDKPIYPIPEGYTEYVEEKAPIVEDKPAVTTPTTTVTGEGDSSDTVTVGTSIGKTGKGKTPTEESVTSKTQSVLSGLQQNTPKSTLSKAFNVVSKGLMGAMVPGMGLLGGALAGGKAYFGDDQATSSQALGEALGSFDAAQGIGYDAQGNVTVSGPMASVMGTKGALNELSMAAYGKSYDVMTQELGVPPSFQYGYKNGDVDPTTNATYAYGQAVDDNGNVSYGSIDDFGISMSAMGATGFMGSLADVDRVVNSKTATQKQKMAAIKYKNMVQAKSKQKEQDKKDKEAADRGGTGDLGGIGDLGSGYGIGESTGPGSQSMGIESDVAGIGTGTGPGATAGGATAAPGTGTDPGDPNQGDGGDTGPGGTGDSSEHGGTYKGSLITKRKASGKLKKKYMKRGGLASR